MPTHSKKVQLPATSDNTTPPIGSVIMEPANTTPKARPNPGPIAPVVSTSKQLTEESLKKAIKQKQEM